MCIYNGLITNPKYKPNKKNNGIVPIPKDSRVTAVAIGCGRCIECKKSKALQWKVRLMEHVKHNHNGLFVTLTFSNESISQIIELKKLGNIKGYALDNAIATNAVRLWLERWRKKYGKSLNHWLITELGHNGTENVHLHGLVWTTEGIEAIRDTWKYGYIWPREKDTKTYVTEKTANYITKYITKQDFDHREYNAVILTSPGIGKGYIGSAASQDNVYNELSETKDTYITSSGHKIALPIYYRNKLYTDEERELLWLAKLDKQERYVLGQKVDISTSIEEYSNLVNEARIINNKLGYGNRFINYNQKEYENKLRDLNYETRTMLNKYGYPKDWDIK